MIQKAGCILINKELKKVGLIYRKEYNDYTFPKGHLEKTETLTECAIRETAEETKRVANIIKENPIYIEHYINSNNEESDVYYYLAIDNGHSDNDSLEVHELVWIEPNKVYDTLTFNSLKQVWINVKDEVNNILND